MPSANAVVQTYVDKILAFIDNLSPCIDIFYDMNVDKKWTFLDHLPTSCLWTTPNWLDMHKVWSLIR